MRILILGGAGFIGSNVVKYYAESGHDVLIFDNLSRRGAQINLEYLRNQYDNIQFIHGDIRNYYEVFELFSGAAFDCVFLLAAQVAVTTSVVNPREDFEINALGTLNVLESMRTSGSEATLLYASTNKVYGGLEGVEVIESNGRYQFQDYPEGISEEHPLDFHSPYGCSKGAADQYVRDYSRIYNLKTIVFRQSCIYGYRQFGIEDQGWVAWFTIAAAFGKPLSIYGDGKQVRDVLFIDDLVQCYDTALKNIDITSGQVYNVGGGHFQMSLLELIAYLEKFLGKEIPLTYGDWRAGDQPVFVSDNAKAKKDFGWQPTTAVEEGVEKLYHWVMENKEIFD